MNVGAFMGGTFDPIHYGHLRIAERVRCALGLPELALLPTAVPPHKPLSSMSPATHRVAMLRLALSEFPALTICTLELGETVAYTVDTLRKIRRGPPPVRPVFVVGMDSVAELPSWHTYRDLLAEFDLIAVARPDHERSAETYLDPCVSERIRPTVSAVSAARLIVDEGLGSGGRIFPLELPAQPMSSQGIRCRIAGGEDLHDLVPPDVALYIQRHGLYR